MPVKKKKKNEIKNEKGRNERQKNGNWYDTGKFFGELTQMKK